MGVLFTACGGGVSSSAGNVHSGVLPNVATPSAMFSSPPGTIIGVSPQTAPTTTPTATVTMTPAAVPVQLNYVLPTQATASVDVSRSAMSANTTRHLQYISSGNTLLIVTVTPVGGAPTTAPTTQCTTISCTSSFTATPGANKLTFTLGSGAYTGGGSTITNVLSTFSTTVIVQPAVQNTLNFTANPVVNSVNLGLSPASEPAGTTANAVLTITATDAAGYTIVGPGNYVDANGKPVAFSLNVANAQAGGKGTVTIQGPLRITAPGQAAIYAHYDGKWLDHSDISVTASGGTVAGAVTGTTLTTVPTIYQYGGLSSIAMGDELALGPDGNIWFCENVANKIGRITPQGGVSQFFTGLSAGAGLGGITSGPDGSMWFAEQSTGKVGKITTNGVIAEYAPAITGAPVDLTAGPDGNIWFTEDNHRVARMSVLGQATEYSSGIGAYASLRNIVTGPDGALWAVQGTTASPGSLDRITTQGNVTETTAAQGESITVGPDGNLWATSYFAGAVFKITPSMQVTTYPISGSPVGITRGPDGNLWVTEQYGNNIDRVTTTGVVTQFSNGLSGGAQPYAITVGSDGNLWFVEIGIGKIGKFVL